MAAPAVVPPRWERDREPASAFSGFSRGRGSRGRGGPRGGRGSRANPIAREQPTEVNALISKDILPPQSSQVNQKPVADKPPIPPTGQSNTKPLRKPLRGDQLLTQAPSSTRLPNRRRRPQPSKTANDSKIFPSASTDSQPAPVSTLTKDPPPHLQRHVGMSHDIDALVERVRAVAMDHRPTTPGSHFDWAGDDDDSLPDLDDWGVTTSTTAPGESEIISPIILEGLKSLPDFSASVAASPLRQVTTLVTGDVKIVKNDTPSSVCDESNFTSSKPDEDQATASNTPVASRCLDTVEVESQSKQPLLPKSVRAPYLSNRKPWHPSLPAKPLARSIVPPVNLRSVATPMRLPSHPMSSDHKEASGSLPKEALGASEQIVAEIKATSPLSVEVDSATVKSVDDGVSQTSITTTNKESPPGKDKPGPIDSAPQSDSCDEDSKREGLGASIHAPKTPVLTESIIPNLTTPRNQWSSKKEGNNRSKQRSGNGPQSGFSHRSHSLSNGAGSPNSRHRIHASRPIITGDAMSRLARTIGKTNSTT